MSRSLVALTVLVGGLVCSLPSCGQDESTSEPDMPTGTGDAEGGVGGGKPDAAPDGSGGTGPSGLLFVPPSMTDPWVITDVQADDLVFPRSGDPTVIPSIGGGWFPPTLDVVIYLPTAQILEHCVIVRGGRNVRIVGGKWVLGPDTCALVVDAPSQSAFVEGGHIDLNGQVADGIVLRNRTPSQVDGAGPYDAYLQNIRVEGNAYDGGGLHPDLLQDQSESAAIGHIYVENFTGYTVDQGFFLPVRSRTPHESFYFRNVDLNYASGATASGALLWLRDTKDQPVLPGTMENVWVNAHPVFSAPPYDWPWYDLSVWPKSCSVGDPTLQAEFDFASWGTIPSTDGSSVTFMEVNEITGMVRLGPPPGGDIVPASAVGWNHRTPHAP